MADKPGGQHRPQDANHGSWERSHLPQLSGRRSPHRVGTSHMRRERRRPAEAKAWSNTQDRLTSGRCAERDRGESEATSQHTGSADPDGGLARHPVEERRAACLPPPQAHVPSHATWKCQNRTHTPKPGDQVLVRPAVGGASWDPRPSWEAYGGDRRSEIAHPGPTMTARGHASAHQ